MSCAASAATCRTTTPRASPTPVVGMATANEKSYGLPLAMEVMRWLLTGKGMLSYSPSLVAASVKVLETSATPDMQVTFAPGSFKGGQIGELERTPGLSAGAWQMRPLSRGYVEARSNQPGEMPAINPRYLSDETDRRAIIGGLRFARRLFDAPALKQFVREESLPGRDVQTDDELLDYARRNGGTCYHASCTCMMGSHAMSVVDSELRVHGLEGSAGHRRLGDAGGHLDQHERADHHDRREGRGDDTGVRLGRRWRRRDQGGVSTGRERRGVSRRFRSDNRLRGSLATPHRIGLAGRIVWCTAASTGSQGCALLTKISASGGNHPGSSSVQTRSPTPSGRIVTWISSGVPQSPQNARAISLPLSACGTKRRASRRQAQRVGSRFRHGLPVGKRLQARPSSAS